MSGLAGGRQEDFDIVGFGAYLVARELWRALRQLMEQYGAVERERGSMTRAIEPRFGRVEPQQASLVCARAADGRARAVVRLVEEADCGGGRERDGAVTG